MSEINWKYHNLKPSNETFLIMKKSASKYPWYPEHKRFGEIMFYHFAEVGNKYSALEISSKWKSLGYRIRTTKTKSRGIHGVKHGSWISGSTYYHVWVG